MIYQLDMDGESRLMLRHFSPERKLRLKESLRAIAKNPYLGKALQDSLAGYHSYRVGTLRIVYKINTVKKLVQVVALGPRRHIYEQIEKDLLVRKAMRQK